MEPYASEASVSHLHISAQRRLAEEQAQRDAAEQAQREAEHADAFFGLQVVQLPQQQCSSEQEAWLLASESAEVRD